MTIPALERWYDYVKTKDRAVLWDALHPDTVFESPVVHTPQHGREITFKYLSSAVKVLGRPGFSFVGEWRSETGAVVDVEASRAIRQAEVGAARTMIERTEQRS